MKGTRLRGLMARGVLSLLLACLLAFAPASAEITLYADQDGVRVYREGERAGLADAEGRPITEALYDEIEPFQGDYALAYRNGAAGVVRRDGSVAVEPTLENFYHTHIDAEEHLLYVTEDLARMGERGTDYRRLIDLDSGKTLFEGEYLFATVEDWISVGTYGYSDPFELLGPCSSKLYHLLMNHVVTLPGIVEEVLPQGYVLMTDGDGWSGEYALVDREGVMLKRGIVSYNVDEEGRLTCRVQENLLRRWLEQLGYDQFRIARGLHRHLGLKPEITKWLVSILDSQYFVCIRHPDGRWLETPGQRIEPRDEAGLYRIAVDGLYGYADDELQ